MITIQATDAGFFNLSPLAQALAPNVLLKTRVNFEGTLVGTGEPGGWQSAESLRYADFGIAASGKLADSARPEIGQLASFSFEGLTYYRIENGERIDIAALDLGRPMGLTARFDTFGANDDLFWQVDLGDALADTLANSGLKFLGGAGNDIYQPHISSFPVYANVVLKGHGGDDHLTGSYGDDLVIGGVGNDVLTDGFGVNILKGGAGDDTITVTSVLGGSHARGGSGDDTLTSGAGGDRLSGNSGRDWIDGGAGDDLLQGGGGADWLDGGYGRDTLDGGRGADLLTGGGDGDIFLFREGEGGRDQILDFDAAEDVIHLEGFAPGFANLDLQQVGSDVVLARAAGGTITIEGMQLSDLGSDLFIFI